ncbi:voltage-dependent calcium channel beta subunit-associated regulatory protein [Sarcophilus harrisii]|uniref:voltage-dependent calcium channel beta subunit-associated regulatory protein n=1 Tax=Sarcophilus harrisii TaxID=9305 RepID=UPI001301EE56|nr:voltage-dependent calcium channel beta subunit-associated regulatory protein [Sarcophilus harrisii]
MSDDLTPWDNITASPTTVSGSVRPQDGSGLLLVLLSVFIGGTLVVVSGALILCRRCWDAHRRYSRASDDPEKTTTTYLDDSQPAQDITIRVDDPECPSSSSYRDVDTERFLATSSTGRRVSFNEAALFEQSRKAQEKGRRYTLTEGDFHHLKNARLTHLHLPPLKIVTIHECDSSENSVAMTPRLASGSKTSLSIFQPRVSAPAPRALTGHSMCPSSALPGDPYNSTVDTASFVEASPSASTDSGEGTSLDAAARSSMAGAVGGRAGEAGPSSGSGTVLQFFTRLRRHASLEGASPYFKMKKWKLEASHRASSLDTRGSPKRHQFQRQRAASESMEQEDRDPHQTDIIQYIAHTDDVAFQPLAGPTSPPPTLGRLEPPEVPGAAAAAAAAAGAAGGAPESPQERSSSSSSGGGGVEQQQQQQQQQQAVYRDIWSLRASLELHAAASDQSSGNDQDSVRSGDSAGSAGGPLAPSHELGRRARRSDRPGAREKAGPILLQMDSATRHETRSAAPRAADKQLRRRTAAAEPSPHGASSRPPPLQPRSPPAAQRDYRQRKTGRSSTSSCAPSIRRSPRRAPLPDPAQAMEKHNRPAPRPPPYARRRRRQAPSRSSLRPQPRAPRSCRAQAPAAPAAEQQPPRPRLPQPPRRGFAAKPQAPGRPARALPPRPIQAIAEEEPDVPGGPELLLADKVSAGLEDRLFPGWRRRPGDGAEPPAHGPAPVVAAAAPTSPDPSPV